VQSLERFFTWVIFDKGWLLILPLVFGFLTIWSLLPKVRKQPLLSSVVCGVGALVQVGLVYFEPEGPVLYNVLFYTFAGLAIVAGSCMILQTSPVYAALWFAIVILSTCGLFLLQSAPFLMAATIIVYAGAIIVTFLFVIMLAQQTGLAPYDRRAREPLLASLAGFVLLGGLLYTLQATYGTQHEGDAVFAQIATVRERVEAGAPFEEIERAMYLAPERTIGVSVGEMIESVPAWPGRGAAHTRLVRLIEDIAVANSNRDRPALTQALDQLAQLAAEVEEASARHRGALPAPASLEKQRSTLSRLPTQPMEIAPGHVTSVGRSLFGDYLWAVELAGTLLLVATIGAIAIAAKPKPSEPQRHRGTEKT
jgi:NADH-quinone oxidoreductase subunit J